MNLKIRCTAVALLAMASMLTMAQGAGSGTPTAHDLTKAEFDQLLAHRRTW